MATFEMTIDKNDGNGPKGKTFDVPSPVYAAMMITLAVDFPLAPLMGFTDVYLDELFDKWWFSEPDENGFSSVTMERRDFFGNSYTDVYSYSA